MYKTVDCGTAFNSKTETTEIAFHYWNMMHLGKGTKNSLYITVEVISRIPKVA